MDLGRYPVEIRAIADEIAELMGGENYETSWRMIEILWEGLPSMAREEREKATKFIASTPSQRNRLLAKLTGKETFELLVRSRYLALVGANLCAVADRFSMMPGQGYRKAAAFAVQEALQNRIEPNKHDMLPRRWG